MWKHIFWQLQKPIKLDGKTVVLGAAAVILAGMVFGVWYAQTFDDVPPVATPTVPPASPSP